MSKEKASELLARFQLQQVEANPQWFAKYEDYCGAKGVEAVRATPGYARLYETMKRLFMAILTPGMSTLETAETHGGYPSAHWREVRVVFGGLPEC